MSDPERAAALLPLYCRAGLGVFPLHNPVDDHCSCGRSDCPSPAKHPRLGLAHRKSDPRRQTCRGECGRPGHGVHDATTDLGQVSEWLARWPDANWGVAPPIGVVVLDVDPRNGGDATLAELEARHGNLPTTLTCRTGSGGWHVWLTHRGRAAGRLATGIDVKKRGGYLVAPPSIHMAGGTYEWTDTSPTAVAPLWVRDLLDPPVRPMIEPRRGGGVEHLVAFVLASAEGQRNDRLFWACARAHEGGHDLAPLIDAAESLGTPRMEAEATANSATRAPARTVSERTDRWGWRPRVNG